MSKNIRKWGRFSKLPCSLKESRGYSFATRRIRRQAKFWKHLAAPWVKYSPTEVWENGTVMLVVNCDNRKHTFFEDLNNKGDYGRSSGFGFRYRVPGSLVRRMIYFQGGPILDTVGTHYLYFIKDLTKWPISDSRLELFYPLILGGFVSTKPEYKRWVSRSEMCDLLSKRRSFEGLINSLNSLKSSLCSTCSHASVSSRSTDSDSEETGSN